MIVNKDRSGMWNTNRLIKYNRMLNININEYMRASNGNGKKKSMTIIAQNIPGCFGSSEVENKIHELVSRYSPTVLCIGEVRQSTIKTINLPGYKLVKGKQQNADDCRINMLVKEAVNCELLDLSCDCPLASIKINGLNIISIYREWRVSGCVDSYKIENQVSRLKSFLSLLGGIKGNSVVLGDMNIDLSTKNLDVSYYRAISPLRDILLSEFSTLGYDQLIAKETRFQKGEKASLLDHVYFRGNPNQLYRKYNRNILGDDHNLIGVSLYTSIDVSPQTSSYRRNIDKVSPLEFDTIFNCALPWEVLSEPDVNLSLESLVEKIKWTLNHVCPEVKCYHRINYQPWMDKHLKDLCRYKRYLHQQARNSNSVVIWNIYRKNRNKVKHTVSQAKAKYLNTRLNDDDPKSLWSKVKSYCGLNKSAGNGKIVLETDNGVVTNPEDVANCFNSFFRNKVHKLQSKLDPCPEKVRDYVQEYTADKSMGGFSFVTVTPGDVSKIISGLNTTNALGFDGIGTKCIKKFKGTLAPYICHVINTMICRSEFPQLFKSGIICPVPKKGNLKFVSNHRPVQLNSPISKIAETVINNQLKQYLEECNLLPKTQNSYRTGYSTFSALADVNTIISEARSRGKQSMILATDMSSAFNLVHRDILDVVLEEYQVDRLSRKLIKNYMSGRRVKVRIDDKMSDWEYLETGVGEGTIVGPLFFILILTPLSSAIARAKVNIVTDENALGLVIDNDSFDVTSREYADDVSGLIWADNDEILQVVAIEIMKQFKLFFSAIGMSLNPDKTEILCIRSSPKTLNITVEGQGESEKMRLLGLHIDSNFTYDYHIINLKKNLTFKLLCLRRLAPYLSFQNMKRVTESLLFSTIMYCLPLFGHETKHQKVIQKMVNSAARIILKRGSRASATEMLHELQWLNVRNLYYVESVCWLSRIIASKSAFYTFNTILNGSKKKQQTHNTRDRSITVDLPYDSKYIRRTFVYNAVQALNLLKLPRRIVPPNVDYRKAVMDIVLEVLPNGNL